MNLPETNPSHEAPAPLPPIPQHEPGQAWELVGDNRYRPRRIKGSLLGRELG
jgi:hypothetical protein